MPGSVYDVWRTNRGVRHPHPALNVFLIKLFELFLFIHIHREAGVEFLLVIIFTTAASRDGHAAYFLNF